MSTRSRAVAFDRVSSKDQRDGFSLEAQEKLSEKYSKENNLIVVKRWSVNESASKENDRKFFFEMIDYINNNEIKDVVFDKVDRACRGLKSAQVIEDLVENKGVRFHFTRDRLTIDSGSPSSEKLRFYLNVILAKYYIDNLRTEIKKGMDEREELGFWNHKAPLGYKNIRVGHDGKPVLDKKGKATVIVDETTAPLIKEIFELYASGNYTLNELGNILNSRLKDRKVGKTFIEDLLTNPFYYGAMKTKKGPVVVAKHQPIISKDLWDACQKIRGLRALNHRATNSKFVPKPFMGFMKCGTCNHGITGQVKRKSTGKIYVYYHCANLVCPERRHYVSQDKIEKQISAAFNPFSQLTDSATTAFIQSVRDGIDNVEHYSQKIILDLTETQLGLREGLVRIEDLKKKKLLSQNQCETLSADTKKKLVDTEVEIQAAIKSNGSTREKGLEVIELLKNSRDVMELSNNVLEKARLAKIVLSNLVLKCGTIGYSYQKPFDVLIDLTARKNWWS